MDRRICPNLSFDASLASVLFFPQRLSLKLDGGDYSPAGAVGLVAASESENFGLVLEKNGVRVPMNAFG